MTKCFDRFTSNNHAFTFRTQSQAAIICTQLQRYTGREDTKLHDYPHSPIVAGRP